MSNLTAEDIDYIDTLCGWKSTYTLECSAWNIRPAFPFDMPSYLWDEWDLPWSNTASPNGGDTLPSREFYCQRQHELPQYEDDEDDKGTPDEDKE